MSGPRILLLVIVLCVAGCEKKMAEFSIQCSEQEVLTEWKTQSIGNGYEVSYPDDGTIDESFITIAQPKGIVHQDERFRMIFGLCDRYIITEPTCWDYYYYDDRDSLELPFPKFIQASSNLKLENAFMLCKDDLVFGIVYHGWSEEDNVVVGQLHLQYDQTDVYYLTARFACQESELETFLDILKSIQQE